MIGRISFSVCLLSIATPYGMAVEIGSLTGAGAEGIPPLIVFSCLLIAAVCIIAAAQCCRIRRQLEASHQAKLSDMRRELHKNALRYKNLLEDAGDAIFVIDAATGIIEEMNRKGTELLGYEKDEIGSLSGKNLIIPEDQRKFTSLVRRVRERGMATSVSITFKRRDGSSFLSEINARLVELDDGQVVQAIIRDITYKNRVEKEMRQRNRELTILNNLIARANQDLQLQAVLDVTLAEALDVFAAEGGGIYLQERMGNSLHLAARRSLQEGLVAALEQSDLASGIFGQITKTGHFHTIPDLAHSRHATAQVAAAEGWKSFAGVPLFAKGDLVGIMFILTRDERHFTTEEMKFFTTIGHQVGTVIQHARLFEELNWKTDELMRSHRLLEKSSHRLAVSQERLKQNLELVEKANLEREHLDRMKAHFLGMISHEFKTPLTTILGGSQFLINACPTRSEEEARIIDMIQKGGERLNEIVNDLLKLAKLESQAPVLSKSTLSLADIFDLLLVKIKPLLAERNLSVQVMGLQNVPYFTGDRDYLEEIFAELLENAIKFTPDGNGIRVTARIATRDEIYEKRELLARFNASFLNQVYESSYLQIEVRDSGIGIDLHEQTKVFDKFYEVGDICNHSSGKSKFQGKGAGLGLAIVKGMVEAHGGMVWVESSGKDTLRNPRSSFFILLPVEEGARQPVFSFMEEEPAYAPQERYQDLAAAQGFKLEPQQPVLSSLKAAKTA